MSTQKLRLLGSNCLITGGSRGIGLAIAQRFATEGAKCVLVGRKLGALEAAMKTLDNHTEGSHDYKAGNVVERVFWEELRQQFSDIHILVNAAGVAYNAPFIRTPPGAITNVINTNLKGPIWGCRTFMKDMNRRRSGCIINVGSLLGSKGGRGSVVYAASKAGLIGLTRSLAAEVASSGVRVNALVPGYIETQMTNNMSEKAMQEAIDSIPAKKFGNVSDVADAALFLATNPYANNCILNIDGALSAT